MLNNIINKVFFIIILILFVSSGQAVANRTFKPGAPFVTNYSAEEIGANGAEVFCWVQDPRGVIYLGSIDGIIEYNGTEWKHIKNSNNTIVRSLSVDSSGRIFVGASNDFGFLQPDLNGDMIYISLAKPIVDQGIVFNDIWNVFVSTHGIYFCSNNYVFNYSKDKISIIPVDFKVQDAYLLYDQLYLPTKNGLYCLIDTTLSPISKEISYCLTPWKGQNQFLTINSNLKLSTFNLDNRTFNTYNSPVQSFFKKNTPFKIKRIDDDYFLIVTLSDVIIIMSNDGDVIQMIDKSSGIMNGLIYDVDVDQDKNLWVSMSNGLAKIDINFPVQKFAKEQNLTSNVESSCVFNGIRYIGTLDGIYYLPPFDINNSDASRKFSKIEANAHECWELQIINNQLFALFSDGIWKISGTSAELVYQINAPERGRYMGTSARFPNVIFIALRGRFFAIELSEKGGKTQVVKEFSFKEITHRIYNIASDENGNLWLNTLDKGIYFMHFLNDLSDYQVSTINNDNSISTFERAKIYNFNHRILFSTQAGILEPQLNKGPFAPDSTIKFIYSSAFGDTVYDSSPIIAEINSHSCLVAGSRIFISNSNDSSISIDYRGLDRLSCHITSIDTEGDSVIGICTDNCFYNYYMKEDERNYQKPFNLIFSKVVLNDDSIFFNGNFYKNLPDSTRIVSLSQNEESLPKIDYKYNSITFFVSSLFFEAPEKTDYQYKLEGYNKKWSSWSKDNKIVFTNLPAGKYIFKTQAKNVYGTLSNIAEYKFLIKSPWYQKWWAYSIYLVIIGGIIFLFTFLFTRKQKRKNEYLEKIVKERTSKINEQTQELKQANEKLIKVDQYKQGLNNMIVHDLKNPINAILYLSEIEKNDSTKKIKHYGLQMLNIVSNILDISKYEDTTLPLNIETCNLYNIARKAINQIAFLADQKNITINNNIDFNWWVRVDLELIIRVYINLLTNSIKFSPDNSAISIDCILFSLDENKRIAKIMIIDQGIGIEESNIKVLFEKFSQIVDCKSGAIKSTGLGLAFCKLAIEAHKGNIGVQSQINKGSVFWFTIPIANSQEIVLNKKEQNKPATNNRLSKKSKNKIGNFVEQLQAIEFYKVSEIMIIIDNIDIENEEITAWKQAVINAVYNGNEELYEQLLR